MTTIDLKYVALSRIHIQEMVSEGVPVLDENGEYVFTDYEPGDEVPAEQWGQKVISRMVEYRRILPVASDTSSTVTPARPFPAGGASTTSDALPAPSVETVTSYVPEFPRHYGGPMYLLSNGEKVKGREAADLAQAKLYADTLRADE